MSNTVKIKTMRPSSYTIEFVTHDFWAGVKKLKERFRTLNEVEEFLASDRGLDLLFNMKVRDDNTDFKCITILGMNGNIGRPLLKLIVRDGKIAEDKWQLWMRADREIDQSPSLDFGGKSMKFMTWTRVTGRDTSSLTFPDHAGTDLIYDQAYIRHNYKKYAPDVEADIRAFAERLLPEE